MTNKERTYKSEKIANNNLERILRFVCLGQRLGFVDPGEEKTYL